MFRSLRKPLKPDALKRRRMEEKLARLQPGREVLEQSLASDPESNVALFKEIFKDANDFVTRNYYLRLRQEIKIILVFIDGLVDKGAISEAVLKPLLHRSLSAEENVFQGNAFDYLKSCLLTSADIKEGNSVGAVLDLVLVGNVAIFIDGFDRALVVDCKGWKDRGVDEPEAEAFVRGPREGFSETIRTNTTMLRRRIKTPNLRFIDYKIGRMTKTDVIITYIEGLANPATVQEVRNRIESIDVDGVLETGYIEDFIKDNYWTPFTLLDRTERPDKVAGALLEGRIAILVDGTPFALIVPVVFSEFLQSPEDYYEGNDYIRPLRWGALILTIFFPSLYVALTTFHQEMIPAGLALSMAAGREGVPFPAVVEALLMELAFDFLREAGIRMPRSVGQAIGVVGAVVLGQAAVAAGIVSPFIVIVVSLTAIASFLIPNYSASIAVRFIRYPMLFLAGAFGLVGIFWGGMFLLLHLASLRSFGVPYLYPVAPSVPGEWRDVFVRSPWWSINRRPRLFRTPDVERQASNQRPESPQKRLR